MLIKNTTLTQSHTINHNSIAKHVLSATTPNGQNILDNPDKIYRCCEYVYPVQLKQYMKDDGFQNYVYAFNLKNIADVGEEIINIGMHTGPDNRVYRLLAYFPGFTKGKHIGPNGKDMLKILDRVDKKIHTNVNIHKNNLEIWIWSTTDLIGNKFKGCPTKESEKVVCNEFKNRYLRLPLGNKQDPSAHKNPGPEMDQVNSLFEFEIKG